MAFWEEKPLNEMTQQEWESLCDGCGKCCLIKLEDEDTGRIHYTDVACKLLDCDTCRCKDYPNRTKHVPDCVILTPQGAKDLHWLPSTCAYRLVEQGDPLPDWHHLICGDSDMVHKAGMSVRDRVLEEEEVPEEFLPERMVTWPE